MGSICYLLNVTLVIKIKNFPRRRGVIWTEQRLILILGIHNLDLMYNRQEKLPLSPKTNFQILVLVPILNSFSIM